MRYFEENGIELSIGQWQKLSIARAFYSDSDIVILDEPTASLDAIAEQEIYNQFDRLRRDKTTVFVSHRLSSATVANKIVVLENGSIVEIGTHEELMRAHGEYYRLFSTQAKRYITDHENPEADTGDAVPDVQKNASHTPEIHGRHGKEETPPPSGSVPPHQPPFAQETMAPPDARKRL